MFCAYLAIVPLDACLDVLLGVICCLLFTECPDRHSFPWGVFWASGIFSEWIVPSVESCEKWASRYWWYPQICGWSGESSMDIMKGFHALCYSVAPNLVVLDLFELSVGLRFVNILWLFLGESSSVPRNTTLTIWPNLSLFDWFGAQSCVFNFFRESLWWRTCRIQIWY